MAAPRVNQPAEGVELPHRNIVANSRAGSNTVGIRNYPELLTTFACRSKSRPLTIIRTRFNGAAIS